ncbi:MAG: hypothetical protein KDD35_11440, partial [Bdellovibrionales bacterium]|nr:hypothetical protein [Bdellovibrionales bacterium]
SVEKNQSTKTGDGFFASLWPSFQSDFSSYILDCLNISVPRLPTFYVKDDEELGPSHRRCCYSCRKESPVFYPKQYLHNEIYKQTKPISA